MSARETVPAPASLPRDARAWRGPRDEVFGPWPAGPWDTEPDGVAWFDSASRLPCLVLRVPGMGHLCGYVAVGRSHPLWGEVGEPLDIRAHGGLTFSGEDPGNLGPYEGDPWWFGFDCGHAWDFAPGLSRAMPGQYRTLGYVIDQVTALASQLAELARPSLPAGAQ